MRSDWRRRRQPGSAWTKVVVAPLPAMGRLSGKWRRVGPIRAGTAMEAVGQDVGGDADALEVGQLLGFRWEPAEVRILEDVVEGADRRSAFQAVLPSGRVRFPHRQAFSCPAGRAGGCAHGSLAAVGRDAGVNTGAPSGRNGEPCFSAVPQLPGSRKRGLEPQQEVCSGRRTEPFGRLDVLPGGGELALRRQHDREVAVHRAVLWVAGQHRVVVPDGRFVVPR